MLKELYNPSKYSIDGDRDKKGRVYYFDNLRFALIVFVVIGHFIAPLTKESGCMQSLFLFIYSFHMPLFIFMSGYFAKGFKNKKGVHVEKIVCFLIMYFLFKMTLYLMDYFLVPDFSEPFEFFVEKSAPWFLLAMALWYMLLPILHRFKAKYVIIVTVAIGLLVGFDESVGTFLCLSRVLVFLPFFMLGYFTKEKTISNFLNKSHRGIAIVIIIIFAILVLTQRETLSELRPFMVGEKSYAAMNKTYVGVFYRMFVYVLATIMSMCVMLIVPRCKLKITVLGGRTLQVYILHRIVKEFYTKLGWYEIFTDGSIYNEIFVILLAIALSFILSAKCFSKIFNKLQKINFNRFYEKNKA